MEGVAHPGISQAVGGQANIGLAPDALILESVGLAEASAEIPSERVHPAPLLDILDDDRRYAPGRLKRRAS
jgi:hypothetical protein